VRLYVVCELPKFVGRAPYPLYTIWAKHEPGGSITLPLNLLTTALEYYVGMVLVKASMAVILSIACCVARRAHSVMGVAVFELLLVCCEVPL
jgi:hypothetical protein